MSEKRGIALAGTTLVDIVKMIDSYPEKGMLTGIGDIHRAVGGCVPNVGIDLAVIDPALPVSAYGAIGADENGEFLLRELSSRGIDTSGLTQNAQAPTGFTDVMTVSGTGERTFFTKAGANACFAPDEAFAATLKEKIFHIGYILLMDALDESDPVYGTRLARLLHAVQEQGVQTSIDVVSRVGDRFREKMTPALRYSDYAIVNEIEACGTFGLSARDEAGNLILENLEKAIDGMFDLGVGRAVIIHCPELGMIRRRGGKTTVRPSLQLPKGFIKGSVGAGDAFCAGCLYGLLQEYDDQHILAFASAAAACNLTAADAVSGMRSRAEIEQLSREFPLRTL